MKVFSEIQRMPKWIYLLLGLGLIVPVVLLLNTYFKSHSESEQDEMLIALVVVICTEAFAFWLISAMKQCVRIDQKGIHYKYPPFKVKEVLIAMDSITSYQAEDYDIPNYGYKVAKWNILNFTPSITVMGLEKVIRIKYHNGKTILIGTKRPKQFLKIINYYKSPKHEIS